MTTARLAVDVTGHGADESETLWVDVLAFGANADTLAGCAKGEMLSAMGKLTRGRYTPQDGPERETWTLTADSLLTALSGRPGGRKAVPRGDGAPFNDRLSF